MIVSFKTALGTVGQITVPMSQYNPTTVHDLISQQADQLDAVSSLSGSQAPPSAESSSPSS